MSPVVRVAVPSVTRERVVPLTVEQVRALAVTVVPHYRTLVLA